MSRFPRRMQAFISSKSDEMAPYNDVARSVIREFGLVEKSFHDPFGAGITQSSGSIFDQNRRAIEDSEIFIGLYGYDAAWQPASDPELVRRHPELAIRLEKQIVEYEYEWATEAGLDVLRFMRTDVTTDLPPAEPNHIAEDFRAIVRADGVGWLTTSASFADQLRAELDRIRPRVFLSYSHQDVDRARAIQRSLRSEDVHSWRDELSIEPSARWEEAIRHALDEMDILLVLVSEASAASMWVQRECAAFTEAGKRIVPLIIDTSLLPTDRQPEYLREFQYIDGTSESPARELGRRIRPLLA